MIKSHLKRISTVAGTLSATILLATTQASAVSAEIERATDVDGPASASWSCEDTGSQTAMGWPGQACYSGDGDWLSIYDGKSDGYSAVMDWEIRDGANNVVRYGSTFNADGLGAARYKNKDFPDGANDSIRFRACLGHWSTKTITAGTCSGWMSTDT